MEESLISSIVEPLSEIFRAARLVFLLLALLQLLLELRLARQAGVVQLLELQQGLAVEQAAEKLAELEERFAELGFLARQDSKFATVAFQRWSHIFARYLWN